MTGAPPAAVETAQPVVHIHGLRFAWQRHAALLLDIPELRIEAGERVFLEGPSGSGKSTLLSLLGGVVTASAGSVRILGTDLAALSGRRRDRLRADHVGFVFQMFNLVPYLSMLDNVMLPCRFSALRRQRAEARGASVQAEAGRLLDALELHDERLHQRPVTALSIGQQQRVAVARALLGGPELLIADEPTSALDEGTRERFLDLLFAECEAQKLTLLLVSHDPRLGALFDRRLSLVELNRAARAVLSTGGAVNPAATGSSRGQED